MILVPEVVIKNELEVLIKKFYTNLKGLRNIGTVVDAMDVSTGFTITTTVQGAVGTAEKTSVDTVAAAGLDGSYFYLNTPSRKYYVWYNLGASNYPDIPERIPIEVSVDAGDSATDVATKTSTVLNAYLDKSRQPVFTCVPSAANIAITNVETDASRRSLLFEIYGGLAFDGMNYFNEMAKIIETRYTSETRKLVINLGFNPNREIFPQASILLPNEENDPKFLGQHPSNINLGDGTTAFGRAHAYQTTYNILLTSDNYNEVILIYHFLKSIILMGYDQFTAAGLQNLYVAGRDISMDFDLEPTNLYHRSIALTFFYCNELPSMTSSSGITGLNFDQTSVAEVTP